MALFQSQAQTVAELVAEATAYVNAGHTVADVRNGAYIVQAQRTDRLIRKAEVVRVDVWRVDGAKVRKLKKEDWQAL